MIDVIVELLKHVVRPSSVTFLVLLVAVGVAMSFVRRTARLARWYFLGVLLFYWVGASPACIERVVAWQGSGYRPLATAAEARGARVVVVLGAGNYTIQYGDLMRNDVPLLAELRVMEGARVYRLLDRPTVIVSGGVTGRDAGARPEGDAMRVAMMELGVPSEQILVERESTNTREEATAVARMLADRPRLPIVLVTSPTHMARSVAVFRAAGLDVVPSLAPFKPDHASESLRWMPSDLGLWHLDTVVYDIAATWYYRLRGWMSR